MRKSFGFLLRRHSMFLGRHFVEALLRQMPGRRVGKLRRHLRQDVLGRLPLLQLILAIADLEQRIRTLRDCGYLSTTR